MKPHLKYLSYVIRHKWFVFVAGLRIGAPIWRLIIHDWSKFLPSEWIPYVNSFYGGERTDSIRAAFDRAWLHHQKRNKHHWQYWILLEDNPAQGKHLLQSPDEARDFAVHALRMPTKYAYEMVADWMGAGRAITGKWEASEWYSKNRENIVLHPQTRELVETLLGLTPIQEGSK